MINLKKFGLSTLLLVSMAIFFNSCDRNRCEKINCPFPQECFNGACVCPPGLEGANCEIESYLKYVGNYQVNQSCIGGSNQFYNSTILLKSGRHVIELTNTLNIGLPATGYINGNYIEIPSQNLGATVVAGFGTFFPNLNQIRFEMSYTVSGVQQMCNVTYSKF